MSMKGLSQYDDDSFYGQNPLNSSLGSLDDEEVDGREGGDSSPGKKRMASLEVDMSKGSSNEFVSAQGLPNMWQLEYVGLYCQYAAVGLLYGSSGTILPFCAYVHKGKPNVCGNAQNIVFFAWNFKLLFAIITDKIRPWGMRRKPWMIFGWVVTLAILLVLACVPEDHMSVTTWLILLMMSQFFMMFSDVPSDGYSVQLGKMESPEQRGQILATGQRTRFIFCAVAAVIQMLFLNGRATSPPDCVEGIDGCWSFGLSVRGYYGILFIMTLILVSPIYFMKEINMTKSDGTVVGEHSLSWMDFAHEIWEILKTLTTQYLLIYVIFYQALGNITNMANTYIQAYVLQLSNFQLGVDGLTSYLALTGGIYLFQTYLINKNWRVTQWLSSAFSIMCNLLWIPAYHNAGGTLNPWYTIFVDLDRTFIAGIGQVLYSLSVIELAKPGVEATTYELIITVGNACLTVNSIVGTQLLIPMKAEGCSTPPCGDDTVNLSSRKAYFSSGGPRKFTNYCLLIAGLSIINASIWVWFLPKSKAQCAEWKKLGDVKGESRARGLLNIFMCLTMILYGFVVAILLLDPKTSCLQGVGGDGC